MKPVSLSLFSSPVVGGIDNATGIPLKKPYPELRSKKNLEYFMKDSPFSWTSMLSLPLL
jgi:hypothetical protein